VEGTALDADEAYYGEADTIFINTEYGNGIRDSTYS